jgi:hypothetical protein
MKTIATVSVAVIGYLSIPGPVRAADNCNKCRDFHRVCLTAHSKAACKADYDICMKHCRQSSLLQPAEALLQKLATATNQCPLSGGKAGVAS